MGPEEYDPGRKCCKYWLGARWREVYAITDPQGLGVPRGRVNTVGVGGFRTGAHTLGFACDSVLQYEVVLVNETVVIADSLQNADLWLALKAASFVFTPY